MTTQLKIEAGKKYRTRGGDEVEVLKTDVHSDWPIVGIVTFEDGGQRIVTYRPGGIFFLSNENPYDLISEIKPKRVVWLNVYEEGWESYVYPTREKADASAGSARIARVRLEFEEGQFDE